MEEIYYIYWTICIYSSYLLSVFFSVIILFSCLFYSLIVLCLNIYNKYRGLKVSLNENKIRHIVEI